MGNILFIGGPGNISTSAAEALLEENHRVSIFTLPNSPDDDGIAARCAMHYGDRSDFNAFNAVLDAVKPDAIVDFCCFRPSQMALILPLLDGFLNQYVFISTCDIYGYPLSNLPMRESDPRRPPNCRYAVDKLACEALLRDYMRKTPVTVMRPAYSMGKRFAKTALSRKGGYTLVPRLRAGLPVMSLDGGNILIHASNAKDTGRMIAKVVLSPQSYSKSYNCGSRYARTYDEYIRLFADALGVTPNFVHVPTEKVYEWADYRIFEENLPNDNTRYDTSFSMEGFLADYPDFQWKYPVEEAVRAFIDYNDALGAFGETDDPVECSILKHILKR